MAPLKLACVCSRLKMRDLKSGWILIRSSWQMALSEPLTCQASNYGSAEETSKDAFASVHHVVICHQQGFGRLPSSPVLHRGKSLWEAQGYKPFWLRAKKIAELTAWPVQNESKWEKFIPSVGCALLLTVFCCICRFFAGPLRGVWRPVLYGLRLDWQAALATCSCAAKELNDKKRSPLHVSVVAGQSLGAHAFLSKWLRLNVSRVHSVILCVCVCVCMYVSTMNRGLKDAVKNCVKLKIIPFQKKHGKHMKTHVVCFPLNSWMKEVRCKEWGVQNTWMVHRQLNSQRRLGNFKVLSKLVELKAKKNNIDRRWNEMQ